MISEFAVDPELFARWGSFQTLSDDFGIEKGRMVSEFPRKWKKLVSDRAWELAATTQGERATTDMQALRIVETIFSERFGRALKRSGREFRSDVKSWREAASHACPAFDVIISSSSGNGANYIEFNNLLRHEPPFHRKRMNFVERRKEALIAAASVALTDADEVILVDPNFRADEPRFCETLKYLLGFLEKWGRKPKRFELHTNRIRKPGDIFNLGPQRSQWKENLAPYLPKGWTIKICYWEKLPSGGKPHPRFILTQAGGLYYDYGLDEGEGDTLVTLLEDGIWETLFGVYHSGALPRDFKPQEFVLTVEG